MDREEFERLKQAEKEHLQELKVIKSRLAEVRRLQSLRRAMGQIESSVSSDTYDEMLERVKRETLEGEVRLDMAMEGQDLPPVVDEEAERAARAAELVRQMKAAMGDVSDSRAIDVSRLEAHPDDDLPSKTIGRIDVEEPMETPPAPEVHEKTIGRVRKKPLTDDSEN